MSGDTVILCEITATPPGGGTPVTLRFADRAIRPFPPGDPDRPNAIFDPRLVTPPALRRELWTDLASLSPGSGAGAMELANSDRALDAWQGHSWGAIRVWRWQEGTAFSEGLVLLSGSCAPPGYGYNSSEPARVKVYLADAWQDLRKPLQEELYEGGNNGTTVLYDGTPAGLAARPKPLAFGDVTGAHLPCPQVNAALQAYQVRQGGASPGFWPAGHVQLYDRGASAGYDYEGDFEGSAFDTHTLYPGGYCTDRARGLVRIEGQPVGALTFGVRAPFYGSQQGILEALLSLAGIGAGDIHASVTPGSVPDTGLWFGEPILCAEVISYLARSWSMSVAPGRDGVWRGRPLAPPSETADYTIPPADVISVATDDRAPDPAGEIRVGYDRIWRTFNETEIAPSLRGEPDEERLAQSYRWVNVEDEAAKAAYPSSWRRLEIATALRTKAAAEALATTLSALFGLPASGTRRRAWRIVMEITPERLDVSQQLGGTLALSMPGTGIDGHFLLIGEELMRPQRDQLIWTLWG